MMTTMRERILNGWDFARALRAAFALMFLVAAITRHEPIAWIAAAFFGVQAIFNVGCCGVGTCQPDRSPRPASSLDTPVTYEEIK